MFAPVTVDTSYSKGDRTGKQRQTHWGSPYEHPRALAAKNLPEQSKEAAMDTKLCKHKDRQVDR